MISCDVFTLEQSYEKKSQKSTKKFSLFEKLNEQKDKMYDFVCFRSLISFAFFFEVAELSLPINHYFIVKMAQGRVKIPL